MKILTPKDIDRLRDKADKNTHLIRYEHANNREVKSVLKVQCPECGAPKTVQCYGKN